MIIGLLGNMGTGKTTAQMYMSGKYFNSEYQVRTINFADKVRASATLLDLEHNRANLSLIGDEFRRIFGRDLWISLCEKVIKSTLYWDDKLWIVGDVRYPNEVTWVHSLKGKVIYLETDRKIAYERMIKRDNLTLTWEEYLKLLEHPSEKDIPNLIRLTNFKLYNNDSKQDLYKQIDNLMPYLQS